MHPNCPPWLEKILKFTEVLCNKICMEKDELIRFVRKNEERLIIHSFFYKHSVNLTQPQLCLRFLLFLNNRPIVLSIDCSPKKSEPQYAYKRYAYKEKSVPHV